MIISTLFFVTIFTFLLAWCTRSQPRPPLPPGPKPLPYVGSFITMIQNKPAFRWIHRMMDEMDTKILCIRLGNVHVISVSDPKIACEFLKEKDEIFSSRPDFMSSYLTSDGYLTTVLVPSSDHWKNMRKILAVKILSSTRHKWLKSKRDEEADNLLRYIYDRCEINFTVTGGIMNVRTIVQQHSSNVTRKIIFGSRYLGKGSVDGGPGEEEIEHVESLLIILSYVYSFCVTDYFPFLRWITDLDGHEKIMRNAIRTARKHQDRLIDERIQQWKDEWAMAEMMNQPRIFDRAIHELDSVIGKEKLVQESDLPKLNYIKACVKEAFRLHPSAAFNLPHVAAVDTTVGGYFIPKGSHVLLSRIGLGRNPEVWDDPLTFEPERHIDGDNEVVLTDYNLQMLSFSCGRRGCPGVLFGSTMTVMLLARLVQGFTWELPPNEPLVDLKENLRNVFVSGDLISGAR
ncbi:cytochrome P450 [Cynara cardunculus var. scolymus]|uniref:Cytochrome P450 n=1 Tax=Cynara cardunculus var. scolymus TaxID=59895 RepID=A0A103XL78_CYNCS|nr:cytochrome P450 [Cynara cardunculus var. scolymus]